MGLLSFALRAIANVDRLFSNSNSYLIAASPNRSRSRLRKAISEVLESRRYLSSYTYSGDEVMYEGSEVSGNQHWSLSGNDYAYISIDGGEGFWWDIQSDYDFGISGVQNDNFSTTISITDNFSQTDTGTLTVENIQPTAAFSYAVDSSGETYTLTLSDASDAWADEVSGFSYSFASDYNNLGNSWSSTPTASLDAPGTNGNLWARIADKDGGYSDYNINYVAATINIGTVTDSAVNLSWNDVADGESNWIVQRAPFGGSFSTIATLDPNTTNYQDTSVSTATRYVYRVRASGATGTAAETVWSPKKVVKTGGAPSGTLSNSGPTPSGALTELSFSNLNDSSGLPLRYSFATSTGGC